MILCVTLNPCLDKTLVVPPWKPGDLVRGQRVQEVVGGKGNNVARVLHRLGRSARPATFLGGPVGGYCEELFRRDDGLDPIVVRTEAPTRVILTVRTGDSSAQSAFFDPDPAITPEEAAELVVRVHGLLASGDTEALTLSGSSPHASTHQVYETLIELARYQSVPVFLDTYGPALEAIWRLWPDVMQVNRKEAAGRLGKSEDELTDDDVIGLLDEWSRYGVALGVVTDGPRPVLIKMHGQLLRADPPAIDVVNPIGSGDALLAGLVDGWLGNRQPDEIIRNGLACAVANALVWDPGDVDPAEVARLRDSIRIE
jgi:1-phosphofructokinase family hexose kinase